MYRIIKLLNGKYHGQFRLQDGTEYYMFDTLGEAIKKAKKFAKVTNGDANLKKSGMTFLQETTKRVTVTEFESWKP